MRLFDERAVQETDVHAMFRHPARPPPINHLSNSETFSNFTLDNIPYIISEYKLSAQLSTATFVLFKSAASVA